MESKKNYCVIMAGGIGSRFWPYSREAKPKQFLDFFGTGRSLLQMTVDRFREMIPVENMLIVTNGRYKESVSAQVPDLPTENILCEPCRRNTAPCIAYAMARIGARMSDANIVIAASDHLITKEDEFRRIISKGLEYVEENDVLLTLGMTPTRPETGYGYVQVAGDGESGIENGEIYKVKTFTEKPQLALAEKFVESGEFLWNSGMFLWNLRAIDAALRRYLPEVTEQMDAGKGKIGTASEEDFIQEHFPLCPTISIDYGVMEKAKNVMVMAADFGWSDLGTWGSLYEFSKKDGSGNVSVHSDALFYNSKGTIVTLEAGKLAVIEGLEDYIVAESDGVLLVCRKENEQQIRQMVNDVQMRYDGKFS